MPQAPRDQRPDVRGWHAGSLRGVPIVIGPSWPVVVLVIVLLFGPRLSERVPELGALAYAVAAVYALLLLLSVLVHEAAHALVGQSQGYRVQRIVADLWGGHTAYDHADTGPGSSALVAVVGPLANGALALIGWGLLQVVAGGGVPELLLVAFTWSNAFVGVFNLLPGLPLDGGFLVEALVWRVTGSRTRGTVVAGWCGRGAAVLVVLWALALPVLTGRTPHLVTVAGAMFLASFMWMGASSAIRSGRGRAVISRVGLGELMTLVSVVPDSTVVAELPDGPVAVHDSGREIWGLVDPSARAGVDTAAVGTVPAHAVAVAQPSGWVIQVETPDRDVLPAVESVQATHGDVVLVLVERPAVAGLIRTTDLGLALRRADRGT